MADLTIDVVGSRAEPYAAQPTLALRLALTETSGVAINAVALRVQIRIEPQRRLYSQAEEVRLLELFGETPRWGDSLKPFLWTHVSTTLGGFSGSVEEDLIVPCTYDFEVAAAKYLHSLDAGEVPLVLLFSGTVFSIAGSLRVEPVSW
ncbi:MAG: DUF6084 family protein, partial [Acidimicrobiales bacterium]